MMKVLLVGCFLLALPTNYDGGVQAQTQDKPQLTVKLIDDFQVTGAGDHASWRQAEWTSLRRRQADGHPYDARFKVLYSKTGLYFLMEGTDKKRTSGKRMSSRFFSGPTSGIRCTSSTRSRPSITSCRS
jgi:hypothetical protein